LLNSCKQKQHRGYGEEQHKEEEDKEEGDGGEEEADSKGLVLATDMVQHTRTHHVQSGIYCRFCVGLHAATDVTQASGQAKTREFLTTHWFNNPEDGCHIYIYVYVYMCIFICIYMYVYMYVSYMHDYMCLYVYVCT